MAFNEKLPEWNAEGTEPPESKKNSGYVPGDKPPAQWWNWFMNRVYKVLKELQSKALEASAYTATDVLEKVKTVDGTGSGLDADMVDGYHVGGGANQIIRRDSLGDAYASRFQSTVADGTSPFVVASKTMVANLNAEMIAGAKASVGSTINTLAQRDGSGNVTAKRFISDVSDGSAPFSVTSMTVVDNLNADMVDGFHSGFLMADRGNKGSGDFNSFTSPGYYKISSTGVWGGFSNHPAAAYPYGTLQVMTDGTTVSQVYQPHNTIGAGRGLYIRSKFNASDWGPWEEVITNRSGDIRANGNLYSDDENEHSFQKFTANVNHGFYVNTTRLGAYDWKNGRSIFAYDITAQRWWTNLKFGVESYLPNAMVVGAEGDLGTNNFGLGIAMPAGSPTWPFGIIQGGSPRFTIDGFGNTKAYGYVMTQGAPFVLNRPTVGTTEPWARGLIVRNRNGDVDEAHFGAYGVGDFAPQKLYIAHGDTAWSNGKGIYIDSTGRVGVKKVNPEFELDVDGSAYVRNNLFTGATIFNYTPDGVPPLSVLSKTGVANLNADMVDGLHSTDIVHYHSGISNLLITTAGQTSLMGSVLAAGNWMFVGYIRVATVTTLNVKISYTDDSGTPQERGLMSGSPSVGGYSSFIMFRSNGSGPFSYIVSAGAANAIYVTAQLYKLSD